MFRTLFYKLKPTRVAAFTALIALGAAGSAQASSLQVAHPGLAARSRAASTTSPASSLTFKTIDDAADPTFNQLLGIDDNGIIAGYFGSGAAMHPNKGYTIAPPYTTFQSDNLPSSTQTQATGITTSPQGTTSGFWSPTDIGGGMDANFGFIRYVANGVTLWLSVNPPNVTSTPKVTQVLGINSSLNAVGFYNDAKNNAHPLVYSVKTGQFINPPIPVNYNPVSLALTGINANNVACGFYLGQKGNTQGFVLNLMSGANVQYRVPGTTFTQFLGVNNAAEAVGFYNDGAGVPHGLIYNANTGAVTFVNAPLGAQGTILNGINNKHQAVGFYTDAGGNVHGLLVGNIP